jgi:hypothetical protein
LPNASVESLCDDLPDWFYSDDPAVDTGNKNFYLSGYDGRITSGYSNYQLVTTKADYQATDYFLILVATCGNPSYPGALGTDFYLNDISFLFYNSVSGEDDVYTPFQGRIFDSTWGSRKTAANLMQSVPDYLEHIYRLQNWGEIKETNTPGQTYATSPLVNTDDLDSALLAHVKDYKPARQILDEQDARSSAIKESLCRQFFLINRCDNIGYERTHPTHKNDVGGYEAITLSEIIPDSISEFTENEVRDIFCEPYVKYAYNSATDKYDGIIKITNSSAATYSADYVVGLTGPDAEHIWNLAHKLYLHYKIVTEPPTDMAEHKWIRTQADANMYLEDWLNWMGAYRDTSDNYQVARARRFSFDLPYNRAMTIGATHTPWFVGQQFTITLPHQTNASALQCLIDGVEFDVNAFKATISAYCYDISDESEYFIENSYDSYESIGWKDWEDSPYTQAEQPSQGADIETEA